MDSMAILLQPRWLGPVSGWLTEYHVWFKEVRNDVICPTKLFQRPILSRPTISFASSSVINILLLSERKSEMVLNFLTKLGGDLFLLKDLPFDWMKSPLSHITLPQLNLGSLGKMSFLIEEEALKEIARMDWRFGQLRRQLLADLHWVALYLSGWLFSMQRIFLTSPTFSRSHSHLWWSSW